VLDNQGNNKKYAEELFCDRVEEFDET